MGELPCCTDRTKVVGQCTGSSPSPQQSEENGEESGGGDERREGGNLAKADGVMPLFGGGGGHWGWKLATMMSESVSNKQSVQRLPALASPMMTKNWVFRHNFLGSKDFPRKGAAAEFRLSFFSPTSELFHFLNTNAVQVTMFDGDN